MSNEPPDCTYTRTHGHESVNRLRILTQTHHREGKLKTYSEVKGDFRGGFIDPGVEAGLLSGIELVGQGGAVNRRNRKGEEPYGNSLKPHDALQPGKARVYRGIPESELLSRSGCSRSTFQQENAMRKMLTLFWCVVCIVCTNEPNSQ